MKGQGRGGNAPAHSLLRNAMVRSACEIQAAVEADIAAEVQRLAQQEAAISSGCYDCGSLRTPRYTCGAFPKLFSLCARCLKRRERLSRYLSCTWDPASCPGCHEYYVTYEHDCPGDPAFQRHSVQSLLCEGGIS